MHYHHYQCKQPSLQGRTRAIHRPTCPPREDCAIVQISRMVVTHRVCSPRSAGHLLVPFNMMMVLGGVSSTPVAPRSVDGTACDRAIETRLQQSSPHPNSRVRCVQTNLFGRSAGGRRPQSIAAEFVVCTLTDGPDLEVTILKPPKPLLPPSVGLLEHDSPGVCKGPRLQLRRP